MISEHDQQPGIQVDHFTVVKNIAILIIALIILVSVSLNLEKWLKISFAAALAITIIPYSLLWSIVIKRSRLFIKYSLMIWKKRTDRLQNMLLFFTIQIVILGLSLVGFHPLVTVSLFGLMIHPLIGEIPAVSLAIVIITAGLSTSAAGTYNTTVNIAADLLKINPYRISMWNIKYAFFFGSVGSLTAYLLTFIY